MADQQGEMRVRYCGPVTDYLSRLSGQSCTTGQYVVAECRPPLPDLFEFGFTADVSAFTSFEAVNEASKISALNGHSRAGRSPVWRWPPGQRRCQWRLGIDGVSGARTARAANIAIAVIVLAGRNQCTPSRGKGRGIASVAQASMTIFGATRPTAGPARPSRTLAAMPR
jgi:hypothetical protein